MITDVINYKGLYTIDEAGNVFSIRSNKNLKQTLSPKGYYYISLSNNGEPVKNTIHRLLAEHFIPNPENKRTVNHKNGIKTDNSIENLEWATDSENNQHAFDLKLRKPRKSVIPVVAVQETSILEFDSVKECAKYFGVITRTVRQAYSHPCKCKGHNIYRA